MVADYYYAPLHGDDKVDLRQCAAFCQGVKYGTVTHAGSLAFGSLLIAIIMFIQKLLEYAEQKNKEGADSKVISCIIGCLLACFACCKQCIEFINKNAYIDIAVTGVDGFCDAAKTAMKVIVEEGSAMAVLNGATFVFCLFGSLFITVGTGGVVYLVVNHGGFNDFTGVGGDESVTDPMAVTIVAMLIGLVVSLVFMAVFDLTADTLIFCVGYDRLNHHDSVTAPPELRELVAHGDAEAKAKQAGQRR